VITQASFRTHSETDSHGRRQSADQHNDHCHAAHRWPKAPGDAITIDETDARGRSKVKDVLQLIDAFRRREIRFAALFDPLLAQMNDLPEIALSVLGEMEGAWTDIEFIFAKASATRQRVPSAGDAEELAAAIERLVEAMVVKRISLASAVLTQKALDYADRQKRDRTAERVRVSAHPLRHRPGAGYGEAPSEAGQGGSGEHGVRRAPA